MGLTEWAVKKAINFVDKRSNVVTWDDIFPINRTASGQSVTKETAITLSTVYACVSLLSETVASLPLNVYSTSNGKTNIDRNNKISYLVEKQPNDIMTRMVFIQTMMASVVFMGNAYAKIHRNAAYTPTKLEYIHPNDVKVYTTEKGGIIYEVKEEKIQPENMIHVLGLSFNGITGLSPIESARQSLGNALAEQEFMGSFLANGASLSGTLNYPNILKQEQYDRIKKSWSEQYGSSGNTGKTPVLDGGVEFKPIGIKPVDAQFLEQRKFSVEEIARIFHVPPHMIGDLSRSTNNNIEQQALEFVTLTLRPWLKRFEAEFDRKLLTESEKKSGSVFIRFNVDGLLRGDTKSRMELYKTLNLMGASSANEIREKEGLNSYEGGDTYFVQANMIPVDKAIKETNIDTNGEN
jgi:HK97 family phage portal protein